MERRLKARFKAFAIHLLTSATIISLFMVILLTRWYPSPYFEMSSAWDVVKFVILVDLLLGPVVTLIVFDIRKERKELTRDLLIVVVIQLSALAWGVATTYQGRPAYMAFSDGWFQTVSPSDIDLKALPEGIPVVGVLSEPQPVFVKPFNDPAEGLNNFIGMLQGEAEDPSFKAERYLPYLAHVPEVLNQSKDIRQAIGKNEPKKAALDHFLTVSGKTVEELAFFPVFSHGKKGVVAIERATGSIVGYLPMAI